METKFGTTEDQIRDATAGVRVPVYGHGIGVEARRNVSGNLFLVIGPIHGTAGDEGGIKTATKIAEAVHEITTADG